MKVTIIVGPQGSGKTRKALEIVKGKNSLFTVLGPELFKDIASESHKLDYVVLDELGDIGSDKQTQIDQLLLQPTRKVRPPYAKESKEVSLPDLIITCTYWPDNFIIRGHESVTEIQFITLKN